MRRLAALCLALGLTAAPLVAAAQEEGSPHKMTHPDGSLDMETCGVCHNEDLTLQRSKLETCTLCHAQTSHAGSDEHLRVSPAAVKRAMEQAPKDAPVFPLAEDGRMYCGTCHFFHDPAVAEEKWLTTGWLPADEGLAAAVRRGVENRWTALAQKAGEKDPLGHFAAKGTRQVRLPVDHGQLCRTCHTEPR
jgi:hypothetical protein